MSSGMQRYRGVRFVVRPVGVSVIKEDTGVGAISTGVKMRCLQMEKTRHEMNTSTLRHFFTLDSQPLLSLLSSVSFLHLNHLSQFDNQLLLSHSLPSLISTLFRESSLHEPLH